MNIRRDMQRVVTVLIIHSTDSRKSGTVVTDILLKLLHVGTWKRIGASLTSLASDTIGIGTRFRAGINLGVYDKVYCRAGTGYKRQGLLMPVTG